jgi:CubicO group peptidase (beta-lactamase class C family)
MNRRELLALGIRGSAVALAAPLLIAEAHADAAGPYAAVFPLLDRFIEQYLRDMNAPGLTLALADASGVQRVCAYGLADVAREQPVDVGQLFHIGSITKSFVALCLLQLHDEGKLDLHRPIVDYLPWLRIDSSTRPISAHDLLTHSAALPDGPLFPADPALRHRANAAPGSYFHYCNMGYQALGYLLATLDARSLAESLRARVLAPLGMTATEPALTLDILDRTVGSYSVRRNDRPYPRHGALAPAPGIIQTVADGCIASTAGDMGAYLVMLANRGRGHGVRIVSEAGFGSFSRRHIDADEFGPKAAYGYGIAVDEIDGHRRIRHTGGMPSFASALEVDLDTGVGVFVSVNSMQGYRPRPVAEYALRLLRAVRDRAVLPDVPASVPSASVEAAQDYAGRFAATDGRVLELVAEDDRLWLLHAGARVALEPARGVANGFNVLHPDYAQFVLLFARGGGAAKGPMLEAGWGPDWFAKAEYSGSREFSVPRDWHRYPGHYRSDGSIHVVLRGGRLWLDGTVPLEPAEGGTFRVGEDKDSPEWVAFSDFAGGNAMIMRQSGNEYWRV